MKKIKKLSKISVIIGAIGGALLTSIVAYAAYLYFSDTRINMFSKGEADVRVIENNSDEPVQEGTQPFKWAKEDELNDESPYGVNKIVQVKSLTDDQYVRVQIIPTWRDSEGNICTPDYISDFSYITVEDGNLLFKRTENSTPTITCILSNEYSDYWDYDDKTHYFTYKELLPKGTVTKPLMTYVRIDNSVYNYTKDSLTGTEYTLYVDVLTDSIEQYDHAKETREFQ